MEHFLNEIAENIYEVMWEVNTDWEFTYLSENFKNYMSYSDLDLLGKTPFEIMLPQEAEKLRNKLQKLADGKKNITDLEAEVLNKEGGSNTFLINGVPVIDGESRLIGYRGIIREITEKKRTETVLKESIRKLSVILGNLPGMAYRCMNDENRTMMFVSNGIVELTGYNPDEVRNNNIISYYAIIHPEDRLYVCSNVRQAMSELKPFEIVYRIICRDGAVKWVLEKGDFVYSYKSDAGFIEGFITDITERKLAEESIRESERLVRATLDGLSAHIAIVDENGFIINVNQAWRSFAEENLKSSVNVLEGANYINVCRESSLRGDSLAQEFLEGLTAVLSGVSAKFEMEYPCHSLYEKRWFIARITKFPESVSSRAIIAHENITNRKLMELELAASERRNRVFIENSPLGIGVSRKGRALFVNQAYAEMFGFEKPEDALVVPILEQIAPESRDMVREMYVAPHNEVEPVNEHEISGLRRDGTVFTFSIHAVLIELNDGPAILGFFQDITKRKQAEMELKMFKDHLEKLVDERTEEIKLLNMKVIDSQEDERQRISKDLHDGVGQTILAAKFAFQNFMNSSFENRQQFERGLSLIDMSSRELKDVYSGLYPAMLTELGLNSSIHWLISNYLEASGIKVRYSYMLKIKLSYRTSINIYRIMQEIFNNIIKHSGARNAEINVFRRNSHSVFEISDDGTGFEVSTIMRQCKGAGLFNIRERVSSLNGKLVIESGKGRTYIRIDIPSEGE